MRASRHTHSPGKSESRPTVLNLGGIAEQTPLLKGYPLVCKRRKRSSGAGNQEAENMSPLHRDDGKD